jgi:hypothetical protein
MFWTAFAEQSPDLAARGRTLLTERHGYAYLATVTADSSPRVHPVAPIIGDNGLFVAVAHGSPKLADLRRDPGWRCSRSTSRRSAGLAGNTAGSTPIRAPLKAVH